MKGILSQIPLLLILSAAVALPVVGILVVALLPAEWLAGLAEHTFALYVPFIVLAGVLASVALMPTHLISLLSGFLFGFFPGLCAAVLAVLGGTVGGFSLVRHFSSQRLGDLLSRHKVSKEVFQRLFLGRHARWAVALTRLPPQIPFAVGNVAAASAGIRLIDLLVGTVVGMLPRVALVVWLGASLSSWDPAAPLPSSLLIAIVAAVIGFGILGVWGTLIIRRAKSLA